MPLPQRRKVTVILPPDATEEHQQAVEFQAEVHKKTLNIEWKKPFDHFETVPEEIFFQMFSWEYPFRVGDAAILCGKYLGDNMRCHCQEYKLKMDENFQFNLSEIMRKMKRFKVRKPQRKSVPKKSFDEPNYN